MTLEFNGPVGDVAGRDVVYEGQGPVRGINVNGNAAIKQVFGPADTPAQQPESHLQAEFYRNTGIWAPRAAREVFEDLMQHYGFTARELAIAWRANSLRWSVDSGRLEVVTPLVEAILGWSLLAAMLIYFLTLAIPFVWSRHEVAGLAGFLTGAVMYLGTAWMAARFVLWPRRIAMRVRKALARRSGSAQV